MLPTSRSTPRPPAPCGAASGAVTRAAVGRAVLVAAWRDLVGLVVPVACAGCGLPDVPWCPDCDRWLRADPVRRDAGAGRLDLLDGRSLPVLAPAVLAGPVRAAVSAWKDGGRSDLDRPLARAARAAGAAVAPEVRSQRAAACGPVLVVAVPSTGAARRRRGRAPVDVLAGAVVAGLRDAGVPAVRAEPLRRSAGPDLARLGARARGAALAGRVHVRGWARGRVRGRDVVLVDDVLTTGATLAACRHALLGAGAHVLAGCTVAATAPPGSAGVPHLAPPPRGVSRPEGEGD